MKYSIMKRGFHRKFYEISKKKENKKKQENSTFKTQTPSNKSAADQNLTIFSFIYPEW